MHFQVFFTLTAIAAARTHSPLSRRASYGNGVATFNNYAAQSNTNCGPMAGKPGTYGAAASDISPDISGGKCSGTIDMSLCNGQFGSAQGPSCPKTNCGKCYKVTNQGGIPVNHAVGGIGNSVIVEIIDACPQSNPRNYCKTDMAANQRCEDPNTNQLDIDSSAYEVLTGQAFGNGPNLQILIEDSDCSGATSEGGSAPGSTSPPPPSSTAAASSSAPSSAPTAQAPTTPAEAASPSPAKPGIIPIVIPPQSGQLNDNVDECYDGDVATS
ncbi:hypothetical protein N7G274_006055 [Stereocaulon virgatum]|uniref:Expansin-like EG45 domain-containing protein n=1 Tax=Stereocaulon virgatum TaxID=373712 RepID=A0ABR4A6V0_9LECA